MEKKNIFIENQLTETKMLYTTQQKDNEDLIKERDQFAEQNKAIVGE